jgi:hypothetical protein
MSLINQTKGVSFLKNNKSMLIFGFNDEEVGFLNELRTKENLPEIKVITNYMTAMKIKDIIEGFKFEIYGMNLPEEKIILFNNLSDEELDRTLKILRGNLQVRPIFAVITPTSIEWEFKYLLEHLMEEREWFKKNGKRGIEGE